MLAIFLPAFVTPDWNFSMILVLLSSWKLMLGDSHEHPSHHLPCCAITKNCYLTVSWLIAPNTVPPNNQCLHWIQGHKRNGQSRENSPSNRKLNTSQIVCFRFFFYLILLIVAVARETEVSLPPSARVLQRFTVIVWNMICILLAQFL